LNIYFPLEIQARELNARVSFSIEAAINGNDAYIGQKNSIFPVIKYLKPGIFFHKSVQLKRLHTINELKKLGHFNAAIDEEGVLILDEECYFGYRLSEKVLEELDIFFSWGENQSQLITKKYPQYRDLILNAGNPRIDILKKSDNYKREIEILKKKHGEFILFISKFPRTSGLNKLSKNSSYAETYKTNHLPNMSDEVYQKLINHEEWERKNKLLFMEAIEECSKKFKNKKIIIRPHPAEDANFWECFINNLESDNLEIQKSTNSIVPWILAANKIVSYNCTTSLESAILGKKSINYSPIKSEFDYDVVLKSSHTSRDLNDLISKLSQNLDNDINDQEISHYIHNWMNNSFFENIQEHIEKRINSKTAFSRKNLHMNPITLFIAKLIFKIKVNYSLFLGSGKNRRIYFKQKFKGFNINVINNIVKDYGARDLVTVKEAWPGVYLFRRKN
tara:strand:- start:5261 stop:6607 length:1347 start_codon:yes stop_codon:yes gene_type:complete